MGPSSKKPFSKSRKYSKYKVTNWSEYNEFLRKRGNIEFMIAQDLREIWYTRKSVSGRKKGRQEVFTDEAIIACLQISYLFNLPLRATQGFIDYLFNKMEIKLKCPDYTSLSKRAKKLEIDYSRIQRDCAHVSIDSSGIQTFTGNEWLENKHGKQYKRKIWKKLHIVVNEKGEILSNVTTSHRCDDRSAVDELLEDVSSKECLGDSGYDSAEMYESLDKKGMKVIIKPPNIETNKDPITRRDEVVSYFNEKGYHAWRVKNNYGRRERVENTFFRFKTIFGNKFTSREEKRQVNENRIKCGLLNRMFEIGRCFSALAS